MAVFNESSITFRGKIGNLCGQRWKELHIIKTKPFYQYQRTAEQGICRNNFKFAVALAQIARAIFYPCYMFETNSYTDWNGRVKTAMFNIEKNKHLLDLIPIVETDTQIFSQTLKIKSITNTDNIYWNITFEDTQHAQIFDTSKYYSVALLNNSLHNSVLQTKVIYATCTELDRNTLTTESNIEEYQNSNTQCIVCQTTRESKTETFFYSGILYYNN